MAALLTSLGISIHAPREGGDGLITRRSKRLKLFQSTPPARGATINNHIVVNPCRFQSTPPARGATIIAIGVPKLFYISIHAPREGGDFWLEWQRRRFWHFNPRPPRGGRLDKNRRGPTGMVFQSTPPARGATMRSPPRCKSLEFQSTPPARGATPGVCRVG